MSLSLDLGVGLTRGKGSSNVDPFLANVVAQMHFENNLANAVSIAGWGTPTSAGAISYETSTPIVGSASWKLTGAGQDISWAPGNATGMANTTLFTIEAFIKCTIPAAADMVLFSAHSLGESFPRLALLVNAAGTLQLSGSIDGSAQDVDSNFGAAVPNGIAVHIAMVRNGNNLFAYYNGNQIGSVNVSGIFPDPGAGKQQFVGFGQAGFGSNFIGLIDEVRITNGVARYSGATYTVPPIPFSP
jgi:concanavalin A-like lectin/glucanase superfamily protein